MSYKSQTSFSSLWWHSLWWNILWGYPDVENICHPQHLQKLILCVKLWPVEESMERSYMSSASFPIGKNRRSCVHIHDLNNILYWEWAGLPSFFGLVSHLCRPVPANVETPCHHHPLIVWFIKSSSVKAFFPSWMRAHHHMFLPATIFPLLWSSLIGLPRLLPPAILWKYFWITNRSRLATYCSSHQNSQTTGPHAYWPLLQSSGSFFFLSYCCLFLLMPWYISETLLRWQLASFHQPHSWMRWKWY